MKIGLSLYFKIAFNYYSLKVVMNMELVLCFENYCHLVFPEVVMKMELGLYFKICCPLVF